MSGFDTDSFAVHTDPQRVSAITRALRKTSRPVVCVPVQGSIHEGHLELVRAARSLPRVVVVVTVVDLEQLSAWRDDPDKEHATAELSAAEMEALEKAGCQLAFVPRFADLFPKGVRTTIHAGESGRVLEGAGNPGAFDLFLTVLMKCLSLTHASDLVLGEKKYQQLLLSQQMVTDLGLETTVHSVPVIRGRDGVAVSRAENKLSAEQREAAIALSAALTAGAHAGPQGPDKVIATARQILQAVPGIDIDYLEITDPWLRPLGEVTGESTEARLVVAARIGSVRLVDNVGVICEDLQSRQEKEIVQAALNAAGLDSNLSEEEYEELKKLKHKVDQVRSARLHGDDGNKPATS